MKIKKSVQKAMKKFHINELRKAQIQPINDILDHKDVLVVAPTSSGKSLIYQLPASMQKDKLTLVLEPTLALMHDQVRKLVNLGIPAAYLDSTMSKKEIEHTLHDVRKGKIQILYVTPERLHTKAFREVIQKLTIYMVVVDECHCVLEWGDTFRPEYQRIGEFIESLPKRPIVAALTATANPKDRDSIQKSLCMKDVQEHVSSIDRPNLVLLKENCSSSQEKLLRTRHFIHKYRTDGSVIVYCTKRLFTDAVYNYLNELYPNQVVRCHAGMKEKTRAQHESAFLSDEKKIMVATTAFGMGVDKGDIELIIHFNLPLSIGEYYQQAGRAGRDGRTAHCVLLYNTEQDFAIGKALAKEEKQAQRKRMLKRLDAMAELALDNNHCMMQQVLAYFGEEKEKTCKHCTNCQRNRRK